MAKKKKKLDPSLPIFQVKISLEYIKPPIWRRVQIDNCTLDELHEIIQISMGWDNEHMYAFVVADEECGDLDRGGDFERDARSTRLSDLVKQGDTRFRYDYDFGDEWEHIIEIEKTLPAEEGICYPRCVKGERACPPEDSGGPYSYPYLLDKIQDPNHEEHYDALEWVGDDFDPEEFDLEEVNADLRFLRRFLGHDKGEFMAGAAFAEGDLVEVRPGIVHERYPDIPLGGWVGSIARIAWVTPVGYEIRWTKPTLAESHSVYLRRCRRDGVAPEMYWVEADELTEAAHETPTAMEQPTKIITRPLSMEEPQDRIRMAFGLTSDDALPQPDEQTHRQLFEYLKARLTFPFNADCAEASLLGPETTEAVRIIGFADPPVDPSDGIVCVARQGKHESQVPLTKIRVPLDDPNFQHVADYLCWLWDRESEDFTEDDDDFEEDDGLDDE